MGSRLRVRALALAVMAGALVASATSAATAAYSSGVELFRFQDPAINESSGVVSSTYRDGIFFTHNDSGDTARFFAVDDLGCTLARYNLAGFDDSFRDGHDIEDIAKGPDPSTGERVIWLADIGDNLHQRAEIAVYRIAEPMMNASAGRTSTGCPAPAIVDVAAETFALKYPDTPHDAETLLADPATGQLFVVTKTPVGQSTVYAAPVLLDAGAVNVLSPVASIAFPPSTTYDKDPATEIGSLAGSTPDAPYTQPGFDLQGRLSAVGGDISPDGTRVVIRTYTDAWEWTVGGEQLAVSLLRPPSQIPLEYQRQGEAIAFTRDGQALVTTCEDAGCTAHIYTRT